MELKFQIKRTINKNMINTNAEKITITIHRWGTQ